MAASFRQWEKDPFFSAADEVQESADRYRIFRRFLSSSLNLMEFYGFFSSTICRMESLYRLYIQERNNAAKATTGVEFASGELRRELRTALGTAKWQVISGPCWVALPRVSWETGYVQNQIF